MGKRRPWKQISGERKCVCERKRKRASIDYFPLLGWTLKMDQLISGGGNDHGAHLVSWNDFRFAAL